MFEIVTIEFGIVDLLQKLFTPTAHYWQTAKFWHGLQIGAALKDYESEQKRLQIGEGQRLQNGAKGIQIGAGITKRGKKVTNWDRD